MQRSQDIHTLYDMDLLSDIFLASRFKKTSVSGLLPPLLANTQWSERSMLHTCHTLTVLPDFLSSRFFGITWAREENSRRARSGRKPLTSKNASSNLPPQNPRARRSSLASSLVVVDVWVNVSPVIGCRSGSSYSTSWQDSRSTLPSRSRTSLWRTIVNPPVWHIIA